MSQGDATPSATTGLERWLFGLAAIGVAGLGLMVAGAAAARWLLGLGLSDGVLLVQELMVAVIVLPLAYVTAQRGHIAVTVFADRLPARPRRALTALGCAIGLAFVAALIAAIVPPLGDALASGAYHDSDMRLPKWISLAVYAAGIALFAARLAWLLAVDLRLLLRGR